MLQPIHGHVTHALGHAVSVNTARVGNPHHIKVLAQVLSILGQRVPACGPVAVPVETLQHHAAIHRGPTLAGSGTAARLARDDTCATAHVNSDGIGACGNAESHIHVHTHLIQLDGMTQHRRGHPEVCTLVGNGREAIVMDAGPVLIVHTQLGREREIAHGGVFLAVFAVKGHRGGERVAVGRTHRHAHIGSPAVAFHLSKHVNFTRERNDGSSATSGDLETPVDGVERELILRAIAREGIGAMVTGLARARPGTIYRNRLVAIGRTITILAVERGPIIIRCCQPVGKHKIHVAADGRRQFVRPVCGAVDIHSHATSRVPATKRPITHDIHLGARLQRQQRHHKRQ